MANTARIEPDDDGARLDRWFRRHYPTLAHGYVEKLLRTGQVRLDGKRAKAGSRVAAGQIVRLPPQINSAGPPAKIRAKPESGSSDLSDYILYKDASVIVLNKPSGLATQGGSGLTEHVDGMLDSLTFEKRQRPRLVHRLDRDTSGVLVIARTVPAAAALAQSLRQRDAGKIYWVLVRGVPEKARGTIRLALRKEGGRNERVRPADDKEDDARRATTEYAVMGRAGNEFAWVAARPVTGRTHQIRVHFASLGTPIVGDFKYGGKNARGQGAIENRLHLHARSIDIAHPESGRVRAVAPLPPHMRKTWSLLGFDPEVKHDPFERKREP
jgi:23S rRNA pseudouridine955/2504/2580 synthase